MTKCTAFSLRKQAPCRSEKWLVLLSVGLRINGKETQFVEGGRAVQRSVGLHKKALNEGQCQAG